MNIQPQYNPANNLRAFKTDFYLKCSNLRSFKIYKILARLFIFWCISSFIYKVIRMSIFSCVSMLYLYI